MPLLFLCQSDGRSVTVLWFPSPWASYPAAGTSAQSAGVWPERCWGEIWSHPAGPDTSPTPAGPSPSIGPLTAGRPRESPALGSPAACWAKHDLLCSAPAAPGDVIFTERDNYKNKFYCRSHAISLNQSF